MDVTADLIFVKNITSLLSLGKQIKFTAVENMKDRRAGKLFKGTNKIIRIYNNQSVNIDTMFMDNEFEVLIPRLNSELEITLNTTAANEQITKNKRHIQVIKERIWSIYNFLPYNNIPNHIIVHMVKCTVLWLNALPVGSGVSTTFLPRTTMVGITINLNR